MTPLLIILSSLLGLILAEVLRYMLGFHSFLKRQKKSWIGFDLDGTLALRYKGKFDPRIIGEPIPSVVTRLRQYIAEGTEVKILTARVATDGTLYSIYVAIIGRYDIQAWCKKHIGQKLDVVCVKDFHMRRLYDDLAIQVVTDTGEIKV